LTSMIHPLSVQHISKGLAQPRIAAFWQEWRDTDRHMLGLAAFSKAMQERMTLSVGALDVEMAPELIAVGPKSFVADCFGADWAREAPLRSRTPDAELEKICARGYHNAIAGIPNLDMVQTLTTDDAGRRMKILYERLIVPIRTSGGHLVIGCMTAPLRPICWLSGQGDQDREDGSSKDNHPREYVQAPESSLSRQALCAHIPDGQQTPC
jgi:hypothetical protein